MALATKDRWGHLTVKSVKTNPRMAPGPRGYYPTGDFDPDTITLACDCGYSFEIAEDEFPGKHVMRTCGQPNCRFSRRGRPRGSMEPSLHVSLYLPAGLVDALKERAHAQVESLNALCGRVLNDFVSGSKKPISTNLKESNL